MINDEIFRFCFIQHNSSNNNIIYHPYYHIHFDLLKNKLYLNVSYKVKGDDNVSIIERVIQKTNNIILPLSKLLKLSVNNIRMNDRYTYSEEPEKLRDFNLFVGVE